MTLDQKIQIWNAVGTWLAGIATFTAVVVSLYIALRSDRVRLKIHAGLRVFIIGDGTPAQDMVEIGVTNLGERPVTITGVGWAVGRGKNKRYCLQNVSGRYTNDYPIEISHGKSASFQVLFSSTPNWLHDFSNNFIASGGESISTLVAMVHTSVGQSIEVKAEGNLMERLLEVRTPK
ncbi:hypothetical protein [Cupriavidus oxalaticus]|uniref:hypothetical protein n=1 Tax=Cupriavidus oxalaticus TaxID=96344 RepID=UPI0012492433|nr:hypothetical protein [Cupriavidus oxalaticus]